MKSSRMLLALFTMAACFQQCMAPHPPKSHPPEFTDGGKTANSLQLAYHSQGIEFENWGDNDLTDSTLTICLINSHILPSKQPDSGVAQLKDIARQIKSALAKPSDYTSYYVIFVTRDTMNGVVSSSHTYGSIIPGKEL